MVKLMLGIKLVFSPGLPIAQKGVQVLRLELKGKCIGFRIDLIS